MIKDDGSIDLPHFTWKAADASEDPLPHAAASGMSLPPYNGANGDGDGDQRASERPSSSLHTDPSMADFDYNEDDHEPAYVYYARKKNTGKLPDEDADKAGDQQNGSLPFYPVTNQA